MTKANKNDKQTVESEKAKRKLSAFRFWSLLCLTLNFLGSSFSCILYYRMTGQSLVLLSIIIITSSGALIWAARYMTDANKNAILMDKITTAIAARLPAFDKRLLNYRILSIALFIYTAFFTLGPYRTTPGFGIYINTVLLLIGIYFIKKTDECNH